MIPDWYGWLKLAHILSSTVLFGTGLGTALHMWLTHRSSDVPAIARTARNTVLADWLCTTPAGIAQPLTGYAMIRLAGIDPLSSWLVVAYGLYLLALVCWLPVVWLQIQARDLAVAAAMAGQPLPARYHRLMGLWFWLGWPAFLGLVAIYGLMVLKPDLW